MANAVMMHIILKEKCDGDYASKMFDLMHITALFGSLKRARIEIVHICFRDLIGWLGGSSSRCHGVVCSL